MSTWWEAAQALGVGTALLLLPGWVVARAWNVRGVSALGAAPALSLAVLGPATLLAQRSGQSWGWHTVLTGWPAWLLVVLGLTGLVLCRPWRRRHGLNLVALDSPERWWVTGAVTLAALMTGAPVVQGMGGWDSPSQASDAVFHLSAVAYVRQSGNASFLGGLAPMYDGVTVYYPTGWHAVAALLPGDVATGSNVLVLVCAALVWPVGMAALLREATGQRGGVLAVGTALAGSVVSPLLLLTSVWPYALSVVLLPGALALGVRAADTGRDVGGPQRCAGLAIAGVACLGVLMAHGAAVFNLAVLGLPVLVAAAAPVCRRWWGGGVWPRVLMVAAAGGGLGVLAGGAWFMRSSLLAVLSYPRGAANMWETLFALVTDHPLLATFTTWVPGNVLVTVLAVAGVGAWRSRGVRPWLWSGGLAVGLVLLASGPAWVLRGLAGPWYTQRARIMPLVTIAMLVLATWGVARIQESWRGWRARSGADDAGVKGQADQVVSAGGSGWSGALNSALRVAGAHVPLTVLVLSLVLAPAWRWPLKAELLAAVHEPERASYGAMLSEEELAMIRRAGAELPADAVVVGDPSNGSSYLWSLSGVKVLFPGRPAPRSGSELRWVGEHLGELATDQRVCEILRSRGVGYYYSDSADPDGQEGRAPLWGKDWNVPSRALELVDEGDSAAIWRIRWDQTPCG